MNTVHEETLVAQILKFHHRNERAQEKFSIEIDISASSLNRSEEECNATSFVTLEGQKTGFSFNIFNTDAPLADESALSHNLAAHLFTCNLQQLLARRRHTARWSCACSNTCWSPYPERKALPTLPSPFSRAKTQIFCHLSLDTVWLKLWRDP